jgi:two-component system cell cycle sensor histidine kinase/response regulator CckA
VKGEKRTARASFETDEIQLGKYAVVRKVADSVAHELNNVLATVIGLASVVEAEVEPTSSTYNDIQGILNASRRGITLTRNLMGFSRSGAPLLKERIQLNRALGKVLGLLRSANTDTLTVNTELADDLEELEGDPNQIRHVLVNLTANAVDAMRGKGVLTTTTRNIEVSHAQPRRGAHGNALPPGRYICLQVSDTGVGMDQQTLTHALEPFFSTKPSGTAIGLGLPLVHHIVLGHCGEIDIISKEGLGTTVTVYLPSSGPASGLKKEKGASARRGEAREETIMLVDDDPLFIGAAQRILKMLGFSVVTATGGAEAVARFKVDPEAISLAIVDLIMPEVDGMDVLRELKLVAPKLPVIVSSGHHDEEPIQQVMELGAAAFIQKPFTMNEIAEQIERTLSEASST